MIVIADTSVILNLCRIGHEQLLQQLYARVIVPSEVALEFSRLCAADSRFSGLTLPTWVEVQHALGPMNQTVLNARLDPGEAAAINLFLTTRADALLIDEALGRRVANQLGIRTIGILGILIEARGAGLVPSVGRLLDRLSLEAGFWIGTELRAKVLQIVNEI